MEEDFRNLAREELNNQLHPLMLEYSQKMFDMICELCGRVFMLGVEMGTKFDKK